MWEFYHPEQPVHWLASVLDCKSFLGMPPAVVVTAEFDILRDEGRHLARRMQEDGVPVVLHQATGMTHGFASFSTIVLDVAEILRAACSRLCIPNTFAKV
ncbi:hypothetical protein SDC9_117831 [bioreactor metagenome]|uniref:Alpha/beta hydrolase fold-3 domain-containing protein n=1 Tax=bioreactor metagenome TaxID=1076179 RepID=A0A645BZD4_9ZZZZ